jgi:hypothetical protein
MKRISQRIVAALGSRTFFYVVLGFFVAEAAWIACSAVYPMPFDEDFHVGIIQIYAQHWLPFLPAQPPDAGAYGAVARDPSYLYQYLMSFPFRAVAHITDSGITQIVVLRLLNVGMVAVALVLFRRVLLRARLSSALTNTSLLVFALVPIVPQLAAHVNYDNLFLPLVAWVCLLVFQLIDGLRERRIDTRALTTLAVVCMLTSLVKYAFLPMFITVVACLLIMAWRHFKWDWRGIGGSLRHGWGDMSRTVRWVTVVALVISFGLFVQRYGVNLVQYHQPVPHCDDVLGMNECSQYGPWYRNYLYAQARDDGAFSHNPVVYTGMWLYWLWFRLFFAINGPLSTYTNYPPLPLPAHAAAALGLAGGMAIAAYAAKVFRRNPYLLFLLALSAFYAAALWVEDFSQYIETGQPVAINGRYLLPILLPLAAVMGHAFSAALSKRPQLKPIFAVLAIVCFLQGGGIFTFIVRSDPDWYWPIGRVSRVNDAARRALSPIIWDGSKTYNSRVWY